jgi:WD40 repeat protein
MVERAQPANLVGHTSSVGVVLVDDDNFVVSCSIDGSVKVWSRLTFDCLYTLYGHDDTVSSVDLSARWLVSGSHDTTLRVYESGHGFRFLYTLEGHSGHVTRVVLLSGIYGQHLALSCSDDASLRLWNVEHGHCVAIFKSHTSRVTCLLVLGHPTTVFCSGSADASICFWDLTSATAAQSDAPSSHGCLKSFRVHKATVQCLLSAAVGEIVFSCSNDGTIQWFDPRSLEHLGCVDAVHSPVYSMALHPTLGFLVCSTGDGRLLVYSNLTEPRFVKRELQVSARWISSLQLLRGQLLACVSEDDLIIVNLQRPRIERVLATAHGFLNCVRWLQPDQLVTSGEDNVVKIWMLN